MSTQRRRTFLLPQTEETMENWITVRETGRLWFVGDAYPGEP